MKRRTTIILLLGYSLLMLDPSVKIHAQEQSADLEGAWQSNALRDESTMICSEKYFSVAIYNPKEKTFIGTHGGSYRVEGGEWIALIEFHSMNPEMVGKELRQKVSIKNGSLFFEDDSGEVEWNRLDDGTPGKLEKYPK